MTGSTSADQADNSGPLEKRLVSKNWSVRANAYDELTKMCMDAQVDSKAAFFGEYAGEFKTYLKDSNPGALEKALTTLEAFLQKAKGQVVVEHQNGIIDMLVEKCLSHAKPVIKNKGTECLLLLFECTESFDDCVDTLNNLANNKNVKVSDL